MCGLVGIAGEIGFKEEKMFSDMLLLDSIRGKHSTGVASLYSGINTLSIGVAKDKLNAIDFMDLAMFKDVMKRSNKILLGHNRHATRGAIIAENAHPFEFENVVGAHNGSLLSFYNMHDSAKYTVDSQALYSELNQNGVDSVWGKVNGAAALTWIDKKTNQVCFLRNKERPLYFGYANKGRTLVWASEPWMIFVAASRQEVDVDEKVTEVKTNTLYTFSVPLTADKKERVTVTRREVKPFVAPAYSWTGSRNYWKDYDDDLYDKEAQVHLLKQKAAVGEVIDFTIDRINDYFSGQTALATVYGTSLAGVPVRLLAFDVESNEELIMSMWESTDQVYSARISYSTATGLVLGNLGVTAAEYTLTDIAISVEEEAKKQEGQQKQGENALQDKGEKNVEFHKIGYSIGCTYCRKLVSSYYTADGMSICCPECWDKELSGMTPTQRMALRAGARKAS